MTMPFYVSPEQVMKDRADYARKGIARGRSLIALEAADGIVIVAENPSRTLFKISEIYDHIAFAGVGKYNEFEMLKIAGIRQADLKGYAYSREDVNARSLANAYAQTLGQVFTHEMKPYEVEILVAQVGDTAGDDELFHILYDGTVQDEEGHTVLGGQADAIAETLDTRYQAGLSVDDAIRLGASVLAGSDGQPLARKIVAGHDRCSGEIGRRDHPVAARQRAGPIGPHARGCGDIGQRGDEPDGDLRRRHVRAPGAADALRVHDIHALGCDQALQLAAAAAKPERIAGGVRQRNPFAPASPEFVREQPPFARDQRPRARLQQCVGYFHGRARYRLLAQGRHNLQDRGAGQGARGNMAVAVIVAHQPLAGQCMIPKRCRLFG